ncbi:MAG: PF20097 family protein [Pseudomonadota bacterium]
MNRSLKCPKCSSQMVQGYVLELNDGRLSATSWISGAPEKSFLYGTNLKNKQNLPIESFRCEECSFLEFYAPPLETGAA